MVEDCSKYCSSILDPQNAILDKINKLEAEHINKTYSKEALDKHNKLNQKNKSLLDTHSVCMMDCNNRKRSHSNGEQTPIPPPQELIDELNELTDDDDDMHGAGNKRRARLPRRRRSLRNRTHRQPRQPRQTRRNQTRNTRRRNGRRHRTRSDRK
jgi:hypothetical protein